MIESSASTIAIIGMFDGVHLGHRLLIDTATTMAKEQKKRTLAITFNNHPLSIINPERCPKLLMTVSERLDALRQAGIDSVIALDFDDNLRRKTAHEFLKMLHDEHGVDEVILGFNQHFGSDRLNTIEEYNNAAKGTGIIVIRAPEYVSQSLDSHVCSSAIRKALSSGDIKTANIMLGRQYAICGNVVKGKQLGRTIGFPTANIKPLEARQLIPAKGVYAVTAEVNGILHRGVMNIGTRPTVDSSEHPETSLEVYLLDFNEDIYKDFIIVKFADRIRNECKFSNLTELKQQISEDIKQLKDIL
jgi:riboflavin kinase/FMN adenylyltransferase